jgi:hypothetical protein
MKKIAYSTVLLVVSILFWIIYNSIFGWNLEPESRVESICDIIYITLTVIALMLYFEPLISLYLDAVERFEKRKILEEEDDELVDFIDWWNNLPDEYDDKLYLTYESIEKFRKR